MREGNTEKHTRPGYADPSPYPEIKVRCPNLHYAEMLMDDYAGAVSEFTAINQYLYHHFFFQKVGKKLGELMENIAINEMRHMEILADLIIQLGGNPVIRGGCSTEGRFWTGNLIYYGANIREQLQADINAECQAIKGYQKHIRLISDTYIQAVLQRIILDERVHLRLFAQALKEFC